MPIKPENQKLYPKNWKAIRAEIQERAGNKCEFCGVQNHEEGYRESDGTFIPAGIDSGAATINGRKVFRIVCTTAHLNHNPKDSRRRNLRFLCQKCHLSYDAKHHAKNAAETRRKKEAARGQGFIEETG